MSVTFVVRVSITTNERNKYLLTIARIMVLYNLETLVVYTAHKLLTNDGGTIACGTLSATKDTGANQLIVISPM